MAQQNYHIGNFESNTEKIIAAIQEAKRQQAELVVFSELSVCGYPPRDLLEFSGFIDNCYEALNVIKQHADSIGVLIGSPARNPAKEGKSLFNAAFLLYEKEIKAEVYKSLLPTYDVFDEYRHFEPAFSWNIVSFKGKKLAVTICEDIWNVDDDPLYRICPMDKLMAFEPDLMINLSASPFDYVHEKEREAIIRKNVLKYNMPLIYCNATGSQTEIVFDGASMVFDQTGNLRKMLPRFEEAVETVLIGDAGEVERMGYTDGSGIEEVIPLSGSADKAGCTIKSDAVEDEWSGAAGADTRKGGADPMRGSGNGDHIMEVFEPGLNIPGIYQALLTGIRDYFSKMNFTRAILGSSGGIDSAVVLALACEALGKENVRAVLLPSPFSTSHSVDDAVALSHNLENPHDIIKINDIFQSFLSTLQPVFGSLPFNVAEENIQSRIRGNLLMAIANKFGYILLNTSNKSELATGYGTLYGDMAGGIGVLGDCYKMQVYELARYINRHREIIPAHILSKSPSAELRPDQKDADSLPEYALLDAILYQYIERRKGPDEIKEQGFDPALVNFILKLVNANEYKRNQFCPIIRISPKAFGVGRRVPIVSKGIIS